MSSRMEQIIEEIEEYIDSHKDQMIEDICTLCRINK